MRELGAWLACLIVLHTPEGGQLYIDSSHVVAVRPMPEGHSQLPEGAKSVVYATGKNFAVIESSDEITRRLDGCNGE